MANTYVLIASNTLSTTASSVTFSSIPSTYTDLVLKVSARTDRANASDTIIAKFNSTTSGYSRTQIFVSGGTVGSSQTSSAANIIIGYVNGNSSTSNTFNNLELYIPSYTLSQNKPMGAIAMNEDNATNANQNTTAILWANTAAVTTIELTPETGPNFLSGSSFFLYGIKNS